MTSRVRLVGGIAPVLLLALAGCKLGSTPDPKPGTSPAAAGSPIRFEDTTQRAGIRFKHYNGSDGRLLMPESVGSGGAFLDYDGDGWQDLFLVNCSNWPDRPNTGTSCALYRNQGDGTFRDVSREAGLDVSLFGLGCAVGDYDGDGFDDLFITAMGPNRLFRNTGKGKFQDVTAASGLGGGERWAWHTSASWADYDKDGRLDLFVCNYARWTPQTDIPCKAPSGVRTYCGPSPYQPQPSPLFRNLGGGKFENVSKSTGISAVPGKGLGVVAVDEDQDGWLDFFVSNDLVPNHLWHNEKGRRFREIAQERGVAVGDNGEARAGMGIDISDPGNNGGLAFCIGNFAGEGLGLFTRTPATYQDEGRTTGLVPASLSRLTFGLLFSDFDRDGWEDLFTYNGHVDPQAGMQGEAITFKERPQLFRNQQGAYTDATDSAGGPFAEPQVGRGCAWGDYDNDGHPDLLLCENNGPTRLIRNSSTDTSHWIGIRLRGRAPNRNAYGAEVRLTTGGVTQRRWVRSGSSYLSQSDTRALFGLGSSTAVEKLEIRWPDGHITTVPHPEIDRYQEVTETTATSQP